MQPFIIPGLTSDPEVHALEQAYLFGIPQRTEQPTTTSDVSTPTPTPTPTVKQHQLSDEDRRILSEHSKRPTWQKVHSYLCDHNNAYLIRCVDKTLFRKHFTAHHNNVTKPQGKPPILDAYLLLAGKASKLPSNYGAKRFSWTWPKCDELIEVQGQISKVFWEVFEESLYNKRKMLRELCG